MIEFKNVSKIYKTKKGVETKALNNINLKIGNKGLVFIVGKSGSGKSTLLNLLGGLDNITSGELFINNKDISKFKNKQYDAYRNTYVGFIFQEFNILENYNVYENIELALRLQNKKSSKEEIDKLLNKLGLENLDQRKINELSGGQKQRVAIARALIKNPEIILADEPTGNLDQISSKQIFDLLKEISKEKLVIVVSHDMESAKNYADRIIEISDGNIINDTNPEIELTEEKFNLKKSKLPCSYSIKMALKSLTIKPFKLLMTCILTAMALIFMGFTINCYLFNEPEFIAKTLNDNNRHVYSISKTKFDGDGGSYPTPLTDRDVKEIEQITGSKVNKGYNLKNNEYPLGFEFGEVDPDNKPHYYIRTPFINNYIELEDNRIPGKIIGNLPTTDRELVIHKYLAEYMIKYGVVDSDNNLYKPATIKDLINSKHELKLGENNVTISGVVDDDNSPLEKYKDGSNIYDFDLRTFYSDIYVDASSNVYVKGFTKTVKLNNNAINLLDGIYIEKVIDKRNEYDQWNGESGFKNIKDNAKEVITKDGLKVINTLAKNEVVLSIKAMQKMDSNYEQGLAHYLKQNMNTSYNMAVQTYTQNYMQTENFDNIKVKLYDNREGIDETRDVKIIGIIIDENSYISNEYAEEYDIQTKYLNSLFVYDDDLNHLIKMFKNFKYDNGLNMTHEGVEYTYNVYGVSANDLNEIISTYIVLKNYILIVSLIFTVFAILLFSNFIGVSISYSKKEIGILRALGARNKDTLKIFAYEALIIGIISWIISIIGWNYTCDLLNKSMFGNAYYILNGFVKSSLIPIGMFIFTIIISVIITAIAIRKTNKIKPIDAILNKR